LSSALSKRASHALRHAPWEYGLELDDQGWVAIDALSDALGVKPEDIEQMAATSSKDRYEISDGRIRARYGHSLPDRIEMPRAEPPATLFHGTAPESIASIERDGLQPRARQYVHLSPDRETAHIVGRRKARQPVLLVIHAADAAAAGVAFYRGNENTWLADAIPPEFIEPSGSPLPPVSSS